jgi:hypothetical protein
VNDPIPDLDIGFAVRNHVLHLLNVVAICQGEDESTASAEHVHGDAVGLAGLTPSIDQETKSGKVMNEAAGDRIDEADRETPHASDPRSGRRW